MIEFLEEANKRRDAVISKASALFARLKAMGDENERMRNENAELKRRLEYRDKMIGSWMARFRNSSAL